MPSINAEAPGLLIWHFTDRDDQTNLDTIDKVKRGDDGPRGDRHLADQQPATSCRGRRDSTWRRPGQAMLRRRCDARPQTEAREDGAGREATAARLAAGTHAGDAERSPRLRLHRKRQGRARASPGAPPRGGLPVASVSTLRITSVARPPFPGTTVSTGAVAEIDVEFAVERGARRSAPGAPRQSWLERIVGHLVVAWGEDADEQQGTARAAQGRAR